MEINKLASPTQELKDSENAYLIDYKLEISMLKSPETFIQLYKHTFATYNPDIYEDKIKLAKVVTKAEEVYGNTVGAISLGLAELLDHLRMNINKQDFSLDLLVSQCCDEIISKIEDTLPYASNNYCTSLQRFMTKLIVQVRCLFLDITHLWLDFYCRFFWVMIEYGIDKFTFFKLYIIEETLVLVRKYTKLYGILKTQLRDKMLSWLSEIVEIVCISNYLF